jgi:hypothetical protein
VGRSQQQQVNTEAKNLIGTEETNAAAANPQAGYSAMLANPGYSAADKSAITGATEGGIGAAFGSASEGAANRAARMNNTAGLTGTQDALARQRMITSGNLGAENQVKFADAARQDRNTALAGEGGLYSTNLGNANATLGHQAQNAQTPGFWDTLGTSFAKTLGQDLVPGGSVGGATFG